MPYYFASLPAKTGAYFVISNLQRNGAQDSCISCDTDWLFSLLHIVINIHVHDKLNLAICFKMQSFS